MSDTKTRKWIAILRIFVGVLFIDAALPRLSAHFLMSFGHDVRVFAGSNPFPWYRAFLVHVVQPNEQVFAIALVVVELLVGVALVVGFLTGLASLAGALVALNFVFAASHVAERTVASLPGWVEAPNLYAFGVLILLFVSKAGRTWGLDGRLGGSKGIFW